MVSLSILPSWRQTLVLQAFHRGNWPRHSRTILTGNLVNWVVLICAGQRPSLFSFRMGKCMESLLTEGSSMGIFPRWIRILLDRNLAVGIF